MCPARIGQTLPEVASRGTDEVGAAIPDTDPSLPIGEESFDEVPGTAALERSDRVQALDLAEELEPERSEKRRVGKEGGAGWAARRAKEEDGYDAAVDVVGGVDRGVEGRE